MALQFGSTPIGAMQYNGVTIGEAMMNGQVVYRSVITVTPQAPTFLTESPWYTLPTQEGVTYTVSGTPGYNQTVTVTATPQAGYELAGQTSWTHTYGPPPRYTASGSSGSNVVVPNNVWLVIDTHTVTGNGDTAGEWSVKWIYPRYSGDYAVRVRVNGVVVAQGGPITLNQTSYTQSVGIPELSLSDGDVVEFLAWAVAPNDYARTIDQWSWALS